MVYVYMLKLEKEKYYVGKTNDFQKRWEEHLQGMGSAWTQKYKPIDVAELIRDCNDFDEDKYTLIYMNRYGIENVRGGSFCEINLDPNTLVSIRKMIIGATDCCYVCGSKAHFSRECDWVDLENVETVEPSKTWKDYFVFMWKRLQIWVDKKDQIPKRCYRCGRYGHFAHQCYAKHHIKGYKLNNSVYSSHLY